MNFNEYQKLASRTMNTALHSNELELHALHGLSGEVGEIHSIYQKAYQGHAVDSEHLKKEIGDLLWFIAELCTVSGFDMTDVAQMNIEKLIKRFPDGFEIEKSLHRKNDDI